MKNLLITIATTVLLSCGSPQKVSREQLLAYVSEKSNGLTRETEAGDYSLKTSFRPNDFFIWQDLKAGDRELAFVSNQYANNIYFTLSIQPKSNASLSKLVAIKETLDYKMNQYLQLQAQGNSHYAISYITSGFSGTNTIDLLFAFPKEGNLKGKWLDLDLAEFGLGIGPQRFRFSTKDIFETPSIDFELISRS